MPEYLAPGVFVEEVSFRAKSIEGVPTSTTGFAGMTRYGPVQYPGGPLATKPRLITSFVEFERVYGGLSPLRVGGDERVSYTAHAARAFFLNGGRRLYVSRVFKAGATAGVASKAIAISSSTASTATWRARWPGWAGNLPVTCRAKRSRNVAAPGAGEANGKVQANLAKNGSIVEVHPPGTPIPAVGTPLDAAKLRVVRIDNLNVQRFEKADGAVEDLPPNSVVVLVELQVTVDIDGDRIDQTGGLSTDPAHRRFIGRILQRDEPEDETSTLWLDYDFATTPTAHAIPLLAGLVGTTSDVRREVMAGGDDGQLADGTDLLGKEADPDRIELKATGLEALGEIDDIAIVALPDAGDMGDEDATFDANQNLIRHAEKERYRIAIVDAPKGSGLNKVREFRGRFDSRYGALYHPWIEILDPRQNAVQGAPPQRLMLPPSGFVAGIYARSDIERGVHKAPANEVVYGLTKFEMNINTGRNEVLNPEGINALRFFEGRGNRVWGARTLTSDPEWKYVNVRRFFIFLEHSIDKATQWAVFEPNNESLWRNITRTVKDFLEVQWRNDALIGATPDQAYFVRCDRTTMTQNDLDNGRLICLIGVAPSRPAEFVIFRIGQWTADAQR
jgi:phage tail sheath protein FI